MGVLYVSGKAPSFVVGRDPSSDLVLEDPSVSRRHLIFVNVTHDVALLEVCGTNGATVGGEHVKKGYRGYVRTGDRIVAGRYDIVWTGRREKDNKLFIRCAAGICEIAEQKVDIEAPPQRKVPEKPSLMLAAGPALTMAIPILLGAGRTIAVLSSVFAGMWAAFNVLGRVRKLKTEEKRRRNAYMTYLSSCEQEIKERMEEVNITLNKVFPSADRFLKAGGDPFLLWNMSVDDGVLMMRTGIGTINNPVTIGIPKDRFAAIDDSLRELPGQIKKKYEKMHSSPIRVRISEKDIPAFLIDGEKGRQMLSSAILQLAVTYPPDEICITAVLKKEMMRYYMWMRLLPHWCDDANDDEKGQKSVTGVVVTDDIACACSCISKGIRVILAGYSPAGLPGSICTVINDPHTGSGMKADMIPRKLCFSYAGRLSHLWESSAQNEAIPETVPFGMMFDADPAGAIGRNYAVNDITEKIAAPIGLGAGGKKIFLDLHEKAAGPHGVIAGTTGSGKSELLTTMILSFSICFPPEKLAFFLIDYKGGGMSNLFNVLPHLLGAISNLSKAHSQRAMIALRSENIRRQKIFAQAGVNNINDYTKLFDRGDVSEPLPHIIIIVDEFAELKKEEPEFMDALISISQVGRSLGMHLILATQKPAGVVDDKIRSNTGFRIALRLIDRSDSTDMLQRPDAVTIKERGRAFLQVGNNEIFECFQSGYAMGSAGESTKEVRIYRDLLLDEEIMPCKNDEADPTTWYELCMNALTEINSIRNTKKAACLWLPFLPADIYDEKAYVIFDDPYRQSYEKAVYDPEDCGHILISGRSGTGKSEILKTIMDRACGKMAVYITDYGGGKLKDMADSVWCGGYIGDDHPPDIARMTGFVAAMVSERRKTLVCFPPVLLVLDGLPDILQYAAPEAAEHITRILTLGKSTGIYVAATSVGAPSGRMYDLFDTKLFLGNEDPYCISCFLGQSMRDIPIIQECPGRGIGVRDGTALEFQAVKSRGRGKSPPGSVCARKYPAVPPDPTLEDLLERAVSEYSPDSQKGPESGRIAGRGAAGGRMVLPAGYDLKSGNLYCLPLTGVNCILVAGKTYSGRHTFLFNISIIAARYGLHCIRADTYEALITACREAEGTVIITVASITALLDDFYSKSRSTEEENELASYLENPMETGEGNNHPVTVAIVENEVRHLFSGRKVFDAMTRHPYGISFGGCLDENRIFDFSYLSFAETQMSQCRCCATVLKYDEKSYFGNIKIPEKINVDNFENV